MRKLFFVSFFTASFLLAKSQNVKVEGTAPNLYINHTVAAGENFYSIGRLYNQAPKAIAAFNSITMEKGLTIGQHLKIPAGGQQSNATAGSGSGESLSPITHVVGKNETLFRIGNNYNVSVEMLQKWNNLTSNNITAGTVLIVGNPKAGNGQTVAASANVASAQPGSNTVAPGRKETAAAKETIVPKEMTPEPKKEEPAGASKTVIAEVKKDTVAAGPVTSDVAGKPVQENLAPGANANTAIEKKETLSTAPAQVTAPAAAKDAAEKPVATTYGNDTRMNSSIDLGSASEGAFAVNFAAAVSSTSLKNKNGEAATFKSVSGWQDKKYYVLMNDVVPGTILKITSVDNKFVYAKVLGSMPEMKENSGVLLRISNAAASHLGIIDPRFPVQVSYYQ